jgi:hypothetical protein
MWHGSHHKAWRERFWAKVHKSEDCWLWAAYLDKHGYGVFGTATDRSLAYREIGEFRAHRIAWVLAYGPIPLELCVLHSCDVRSCARPEHLWLGTNIENTEDRDKKGRGRVACGENNPGAKLTTIQVAAIRAMADKQPQWMIAEQFGISQANVSSIIRRVTWRDA